MENKNVGMLIIGVAVVIIVIIFLFNNSLKNYVYATCPIVHGDNPESCPALITMKQQNYLSLSIVGILIVIGLVLFFSKQKEKIVIRRVKEKIKHKKIDLSNFTKEEKKVFSLIKEEKAIFQADLIEKSGFGKVKITRILDRLEGHDLIERKRRGMTNVIVLKD